MQTNKEKLVLLLNQFSEEARKLDNPFNTDLATNEANYKAILNTIPDDLEADIARGIESNPNWEKHQRLKTTLLLKLDEIEAISSLLPNRYKNLLVPIEAAMRNSLNGIYRSLFINDNPSPNTSLPFKDILGLNVGKYVDQFLDDDAQPRSISYGENVDYSLFMNDTDCTPTEANVYLTKYIRIFLLMEDIFRVELSPGTNEYRLTTPASHSWVKTEIREQNSATGLLTQEDRELSIADMKGWVNRLRKMKEDGMHIRVSPEMLKKLSGITRGFPDKWYRAEEWGCTAASIQKNAATFIDVFLTACKSPNGSYYFDVFEIGNEPWGQPGLNAYRAIAAGIIEGCVNHFGNKNADSWPITLSHAAFQVSHEQHQLTRNDEKYHNIKVSDNVRSMTEGTFRFSAETVDYPYDQFIKEINIHPYPFGIKEGAGPNYQYHYNERTLESTDPERVAIISKLKEKNSNFKEENLNAVKSYSLINAGPERPASESEFAHYRPFADYAAANNMNWVASEWGWTTGLDVTSLIKNNKQEITGQKRIIRLGIGGIAQAAYVYRALLIFARYNINKAYIYQAVDESGLGNFHSSGLFKLHLGKYNKPNGDEATANLGTRKSLKGKPSYTVLLDFMQKHGTKKFLNVIHESEIDSNEPLYVYAIGETVPTHIVAWLPINADLTKTQAEQKVTQVSPDFEININGMTYKTNVSVGLIPKVYAIENLVLTPLE